MGGVQANQLDWLGCVVRDERNFLSQDNIRAPLCYSPTHGAEMAASRTASSFDLNRSWSASFISDEGIADLIYPVATPADGEPPLLPGICRVWQQLSNSDVGCASDATDRPLLDPLFGARGVAVVLHCVIRGKWQPIGFEPSSRVATCIAQGHMLKPGRSYADARHFVVRCSRQLDPRRVYFRSAAREAYLLFVRGTLCERARLRGSAGRWERFEMCPTAAQNPWCFHLRGRSSHSAVCFSEQDNCFVQSSCQPSCEPAVFALQASDSADMLQEVSNLMQACADQSAAVRDLGKQCRLHKSRSNTPEAETCDSLDQLTAGHDRADTQLMFMQDHLDFLRKQLNLPRSEGGGGLQN
jgi:hypothetical protein